MAPIAPRPTRRRFPLRQLLPWALTLAAVTCTQDQTGPGRAGLGYFSFRPVYALAGGAHLSQFGIVADSVHVHLTRPINQLVLDTTVFFPPDSGQLKLALPVELQQSPESLTALVEISAGGVVVFRDSTDVEVKDGPPGSSPPPVVTFAYVGPGTNIATLQLVPGDTTIFLGDTAFFGAVALDSSSAPVLSFYVGWKTSDTTVARINANGRLIAPAARGNVDVIGFTPTGISDTITVTFAPVPVIITADSGAGQLGIVGDSLAALFVARVKGADSLGIAGVAVRFSAVTAGGAIRDTLLLTDALGRVRTRGVLGTNAIGYSYSATIVGSALPPATFGATASAAIPSAIAILSGNAQTDTVGDLLPAPLVVKVTDAFGNPVAGAQVVFGDLAGPATPDTVVTIANGTASAPFTLRPTIGIDSIQASLVGTGASVVFTVTGIAGGPAAVAVDSGNAQSISPTVVFVDSLVARVTDSQGNPVAGAKVTWIVTVGSGTLSNDTTLSGPDGRARVAVTAGTSAGALHVQGSAAGAVSTAQFALTVTPGAANTFLAISGDTQSAVPNGVLAQPVVVAVRDAFGNGVPGVTVDFTVIAGLGSVDSATATTDASGFANSGNWTLGPVAGTNQVRATTKALTADTLLFTAIGLPIGATKQWTGAVSGLWSVAGNWSPTGVPTAGDNVFIPVTATAPIVDLTESIGGLQVEAGATVTIAAVTLNTSGNVEVLGNVTGSGLLSVNGSGTTLAGTFTGPLLGVQGTVTQAGPVSSTGPVTISAGSLTPNGFPLNTAVNFTVSGTGLLAMTNAADSVDVGGGFTVSSTTSSTGTLNAGVLVLRGGFTQSLGTNTNFAPSGTHRTRFLGAAAQTITFSAPGSANSRFQDLEFGDPAGVTLASTVTAMGPTAVTAGTVTGIGRTINLGSDLVATYANWQVSTTLWGASPTVYPDSLPRNVTVFNGFTLNKPFKVDSNLVVNSTGVLTLNGNALRVGGGLTQGGILRMQNAADTLDVGGLFNITSTVSGVGDLTDGLLILRNALTQSGASASFRPSAAHRTLVTSAGSAALAFSSAASGFNHVTFAAAGGTTIAGNLGVSGNILAQSGVVSGPDTLVLTGDTLTRGPGAVWALAATDVVTHLPTLPDSVSGSLILRDTVSLSSPLFVLNDLILDGSTSTMLPNQHRIWTDGKLTVRNGGLLEMSAGDTVHVTGNATFTGRPTNGTLTGGRLELEGNLSVLDDSGFVAGPAHVTAISGFASPILSFSVPAAGHGEFGVLDLTAASGGITLASDVRVAGALDKAAGTTVNVAGGGHVMTVDGDLEVDDMLFDQARLVARDADNVATFDNVSFIDQDPTATQFTFTGPGGTDTLKFHNIGFGTVPTTGHYVRVADSTANGLPVQVAFYNSFPLNGGTFELTDAGAGDAAKVLWSRLVWYQQPDSVSQGGFFAPAPSLAAVDPDSVLITGFTGTVTMGLAVDPSGGLAVLTGNSVAAVNGIATFDSLTVSLADLGYVFQASSPELGLSPPSGSFIVLAPLPPGTTTAFTDGGGDGSWDNPANWTAGVPDSADNVFIYPNLTATVSSPSRANRVTVGTGASLLLNNTLAVDSSVAAGNTIAGGGTLIAQGSGTLDGQVGDLIITGPYALPAGGHLSAQSITVSGAGSLDLNGRRVDVSNDFGTTGAATLKMTQPGDSLFVGGNFTADGGSTAGMLSAGLLQIAGNFLQTSGGGTDNFKAVPGHLTRFTGGSGGRTIAFATPVDPSNPFFLNGSAFGDLDLTSGADSLNSVVTTIGATTIDSANVGGQTLAVNGALSVTAAAPGLFVSSLYTGGGLDYQPAPATYNVFETFFFGGPSIPVLPYQWLRVGFATIPMAGDLSVSQVTIGGQGEGSSDSYGGELAMNGHTLTTTGNFTLTGFGQLTMAAATDSLDVGGNFTAGGGDMNGRLTDGVIVARGSVYLQPNWVDTTFRASGNHRFRMAAAGAADLWITQGAGDPIQFNRLTVDPGTTVNFNQFTSGALVVADTFGVHGFFLQASPAQKVVDLGDLYVGTSVGINVDTVELHQGIDVDLSTFSTQVVRYVGTGQTVDSFVTYHDLEVTGTAVLGGRTTVSNDLRVRGTGTLDLAGHQVTVADSLLVAESGLLVMTDPADTADVGVTASFDGRDSDGWLTAGVLRFNYFVQNATTSPNAFRATGTHKAVLLEQNPLDNTEFITFATPGMNASRFQELTIDGGGSGFTYLNGGTIIVADSFFVPPGGSGGIFASSTTLKVGGPFDVQTGTIAIQFDTLELQGAVNVPTSTLANNVTRFAGAGQVIPDSQSYQRIEITGSASLETGGGDVVANDVAIAGNGHLTLGPLDQLTTGGPFATSGNGTLTMNDPGTQLFVGGTATFAGGSTAGLLTAGTMKVVGDLVQTATTSDSAFHPTVGLLTQFTGARHHVVSFASADLNYGANFGELEVTAYDTLDINGGHPVVFGHTTLDPTAALVDAPNTGTFAALGPFTAGASATITVHDTDFRDTVAVDPTAVYSVLYTGYNFYTLPIPSLPYTNLVFQDGAPSLGANISATGFVGVNGTQLTAGGGNPMSLTFNGHSLTTAGFGTGSYGGIVMDQPGDSLIVNGPASFQGQSELGKLTAGVIRFGGDLSTDTVSGGARSAFVTEGTVTEFVTGVPHDIRFFDPDSSYLADVNSTDPAALQLHFTGRTRIAGNLNAYGLDLSGDTLVVDSTVTGGPAGASATLTMLRTGQIYGGTSFATYAIGTTQFTAPGQLLSLPYDTLVVSDTLLGSYSQVVAANRVVVTGPGDPLHAGPHSGWLFLQGGDGNTTINVNGDVIVSGTGATIYSNRGTLTVTGNLLVDQGGLLVSTATGCCGTSLFDIAGNATFNGASTRDSLTGGRLMVGGDFTQGGPDPESFATDTGFTVEFTNAGTQQVTFANPDTIGGGGSQIGLLQLDGGTLQLNSDVVSGTFVGNGGTLTSNDRQLTATRDMAVDAVTFDHTRMVYDSPISLSYFDDNVFINMNPALPQLKLNFAGTGTVSFNNDDFDDAGALFVEATSYFGLPFTLDIGGPDQTTGSGKTSTPDGFVLVNWGP